MSTKIQVKYKVTWVMFSTRKKCWCLCKSREEALKVMQDLFLNADCLTPTMFAAYEPYGYRKVA
jgi:hypothetical protein